MSRTFRIALALASLISGVLMVYWYIVEHQNIGEIFDAGRIMYVPLAFWFCLSVIAKLAVIFDKKEMAIFLLKADLIAILLTGAIGFIFVLSVLTTNPNISGEIHFSDYLFGMSIAVMLWPDMILLSLINTRKKKDLDEQAELENRNS